jgi:hypothetical protein
VDQHARQTQAGAGVSHGARQPAASRSAGYCATPAPSNVWDVTAPVGSWDTYVGENPGFRVRYPAGWEFNDRDFEAVSTPDGGRVHTVMFRPRQLASDWAYGISVHARDSGWAARLVGEADSAISFRQYDSSAVVVDGFEGTRTVITSCEAPSLYTEVVVLDARSYTYYVVNSGIRDTTFASFYASMRFER